MNQQHPIHTYVTKISRLSHRRGNRGGGQLPPGMFLGEKCERECLFLRRASKAGGNVNFMWRYRLILKCNFVDCEKCVQLEGGHIVFSTPNRRRGDEKSTPPPIFWCHYFSGDSGEKLKKINWQQRRHVKILHLHYIHLTLSGLRGGSNFGHVSWHAILLAKLANSEFRKAAGDTETM